MLDGASQMRASMLFLCAVCVCEFVLRQREYCRKEKQVFKSQIQLMKPPRQRKPRSLRFASRRKAVLNPLFSPRLFCSVKFAQDKSVFFLPSFDRQVSFLFLRAPPPLSPLKL